MPPINSRQQPAFHRRRQPSPVLLHKNIADRSLRQFAPRIQKQYLVKTRLGCCPEGWVVEPPVRGLMKEHPVSRVRSLGPNADPRRFLFSTHIAQRFARNERLSIGTHQQSNFPCLFIRESVRML